MMKIAGILLFVLLVSAEVINVRAATITAASCSASHVQTALNQAQAGDTVNIPAGTCHWTTPVSWTAPANVTLRGAGSLSVVGGGDATVIVDDYTANAILFRITINASGTFRLSGVTVQGGVGVVKDPGVIVINGPGTVRIDHVHFNPQLYTDALSHSTFLLVGDRVYGVLDHSVLDWYATSAIYIFNGEGPDLYGNTAWASDTDFGQSSFWFIEDNQIHGALATISSRVSDCYTAGRVVVRYNTLAYTSGPEVHATGHAGDGRGCRATETYGNHFTVAPGQTTPAYAAHDASSGAAVVWGNTADTDSLKNMILFNVTRKNNFTYAQLATPDRWGYCGTAFNGVRSNWDGNTSTLLGYPCIDQPGRGKGDLLTGIFSAKVNSTTGTIAWPHQALEPIYTWSNSGAPAAGWGGSFYAEGSGGRVVADRDYYAQASGVQVSASSPFDGTTGTGWGPRAFRPATCRAGVGYWSTDQGGNWNTTNASPNDGTLDICTATNTWTNSVYTPYTYPHPLTQSQSNLAPPTNFRTVP